MIRKIWESGSFRITEHINDSYSMKDLKGDSFDPEVVTNVTCLELHRQEKEFEDKVNREGVYGYVLDHWEPAVDSGWESIDSCWGFVGQYHCGHPKFNHYIVKEMIGTARRMEALATQGES